MVFRRIVSVVQNVGSAIADSRLVLVPMKRILGRGRKIGVVTIAASLTSGK